MDKIVVRQGDCEIELHSVNSLLLLPLDKLRKLFKIMFLNARENEQAIETIRAWLPSAGDAKDYWQGINLDAPIIDAKDRQTWMKLIREEMEKVIKRSNPTKMKTIFKDMEEKYYV